MNKTDFVDPDRLNMSATTTNSLPQTNGDINCSNNPKVSATNSVQMDDVKTKFVMNGSTSNSDSGNVNGSTNDKNNRTAQKKATDEVRAPPLAGDINNPNVTEPITIVTTTATSSNGVAATVVATTPAVSRTLTRNNCSNANGQSIAKSWYARCNRWRSQSCDRRKHTSTRYSWNMISNRPA